MTSSLMELTGKGWPAGNRKENGHCCLSAQAQVVDTIAMCRDFLLAGRDEETKVRTSTLGSGKPKQETLSQCDQGRVDLKLERELEWNLKPQVVSI